MYKVLIVDDDVTVREYLRRLISWNELGFELAGDAINGRDALNKIEACSPDIIILDLSMPIMSGTELMKSLSEKGINCKVIVLSCHDDYDNVIDAMKSGAVDFLLKHRMKECDLIRVLNQAVAKIEKESSELEERAQLKKNADISMHTMRKNFINDLIKGHLREPKSIEKRLRDLKSGISLKNSVVCVIGIDNLNKWEGEYGQSLNENIITSFENYLYKVESERKSCICAGDDNGLFYIIISYEPYMSYLAINRDIYNFLTEIVAGSKNGINVSLTIGVSDICFDVSEISKFFSHAQYAYNCSFYKGKGQIIHFNEVQKYNHKPLKSIKQYEKIIYDSIISNPQNIINVLDTMYFEIAEENASLDFLKDFNIEIISLLKKLLHEFGISDEEIYGNNCFPYKHVNLLETLDELKVWLCEIMNKISEEINQRNNKNKHKETINKALFYIEQNYMHNITLDDVAAYVNLSKAYFSSFFKKELNVSLIEYLTGFRIEKARELLESTELKVYNIALNVGIDNYRYFSKVFKEATGLTPVEYKTMKKSNRIS